MGEQHSHLVSEFRGVPAPEPLQPVGYAALIDRYQLKVPLPRTLAGIATRHHPASTPEWRVLTPRHQPNGSSRDVVWTSVPACFRVGPRVLARGFKGSVQLRPSSERSTD